MAITRTSSPHEDLATLRALRPLPEIEAGTGRRDFPRLRAGRRPEGRQYRQALDAILAKYGSGDAFQAQLTPAGEAELEGRTASPGFSLVSEAQASEWELTPIGEAEREPAQPEAGGEWELEPIEPARTPGTAGRSFFDFPGEEAQAVLPEIGEPRPSPEMREQAPPPIPTPMTGPRPHAEKSIWESRTKAPLRGFLETSALLLEAPALSRRMAQATAAEHAATIRLVPQMTDEQFAGFLEGVAESDLPPSAKTETIQTAREVRAGRMQPPAEPPVRVGEENLAETAKEAVESAAEDVFIPREHERDLGVQVARGIGSTIPFALTRTMPGGRALLPFVAAGIGTGEAIKRAALEGASDEEQARAGLLGAAPGLTDVAPIELLFRGVPVAPGVKGALYGVARAMVRQGVIEGTQEAVQEFLQNAIARYQYAEDQGLFENLGESAKVGALVGLLFGAGAGGAQVAAAQPREGREKAPRRPRRAFAPGEAETAPEAPPTSPREAPERWTLEPIEPGAELAEPIRAEAETTIRPGEPLAPERAAEPQPPEAAAEPVDEAEVQRRAVERSERQALEALSGRLPLRPRETPREIEEPLASAQTRGLVGYDPSSGRWEWTDEGRARARQLGVDLREAAAEVRPGEAAAPVPPEGVQAPVWPGEAARPQRPARQPLGEFVTERVGGPWEVRQRRGVKPSRPDRTVLNQREYRGLAEEHRRDILEALEAGEPVSADAAASHLTEVPFVEALRERGIEEADVRRALRTGGPLTPARTGEGAAPRPAGPTAAPEPGPAPAAPEPTRAPEAPAADIPPIRYRAPEAEGARQPTIERPLEIEGAEPTHFQFTSRTIGDPDRPRQDWISAPDIAQAVGQFHNRFNMNVIAGVDRVEPARYQVGEQYVRVHPDDTWTVGERGERHPSAEAAIAAAKAQAAEPTPEPEVEPEAAPSPEVEAARATLDREAAQNEALVQQGYVQPDFIPTATVKQTANLGEGHLAGAGYVANGHVIFDKNAAPRLSAELQRREKIGSLDKAKIRRVLDDVNVKRQVPFEPIAAYDPDLAGIEDFREPIVFARAGERLVGVNARYFDYFTRQQGLELRVDPEGGDRTPLGLFRRGKLAGAVMPVQLGSAQREHVETALARFAEAERQPGPEPRPTGGREGPQAPLYPRTPETVALQKRRAERSPEVRRKAKELQRDTLARLRELRSEAASIEQAYDQWRDRADKAKRRGAQAYVPQSAEYHGYVLGFENAVEGRSEPDVERMRADQAEAARKGFAAGRRFLGKSPAPTNPAETFREVHIPSVTARGATMRVPMRTQALDSLMDRLKGQRGEVKFYSRAGAAQALPGERYVGARPEMFRGEEIETRRSDEPITRESVLEPLMGDLGVPLYQGRIRGKAAGFFRPRFEEVRIAKQNDIEVAAHEIAHLLDKRFPQIRRQWKPATKANAAIREELRGVSYDKKKLFEGFAEFVRLWATQSDKARQRAPEFYEWFEGFLDGNRHGPALRRAQAQMHEWMEQSAADRAQSKIGLAENVNAAFEGSLGNRFRQWALDDLQAILDLERTLTGDVAEGGVYQNARLTRGVTGIVQASLQYGAPRWVQGEIVLVDGENRPLWRERQGQIVENEEATPWGLERILEPVSDDLRAFGLYAIGRRAEHLKARGRERLFSKPEIRAMLALETPARRQAFEHWQTFNKQLLDFAEQSGVIDPLARQGWETDVYLPFWRVSSGAPATQRAAGIPGFTKLIRPLRGGTGNLRDPIANMFQNTRTLIETSLYNDARRKIANEVLRAQGGSPEQPGGARFMARIPKANKAVHVDSEQLKRLFMDQVREAQELDADTRAALEAQFDTLEPMVRFWLFGQPPKGANVIAVMKGGKPEFYEVADPLLLRAFKSIPRDPRRPWGWRFLAAWRRLGQRSVTWSFDFAYRNIVRDNVMASVLSETGYRPFVDAARGFRSRLAHDATYRAWLANGGAQASFWSTERGFERHLRSYYERHGIPYELVVNTPMKFADFMDRFLDAFETATRLGEFRRAVRRGESLRGAAYRAREISTDFAMRGDSNFLGFFYDTVMFLKAGMVGVDRVYRGFVSQPNRGRVALRTGALALASVGLYLMNRDNPLYDELPEWDRDLHWHAFIPKPEYLKELFETGTLPDVAPEELYHHFRFPKPWEIGGISTIAERSVEGVLDKEPEQAGKIANVVREMFRYEIVPQFGQPIAEQVANKMFFFDRPIEPLGVRSLEPWARATPGTSRTMRALGRLQRDLPREVQLSPARLEHLLRGYFNTWALYGLTVADQVFFDDIPELRIDEYPVARSTFRQHPARTTRYATEFYEMVEEAIEARRTMREMYRSYRPELGEELVETQANREYGQLTTAQQYVRGVHAEMRRIAEAPELEEVREIAERMGKRDAFASKIGKLRLSKAWRDKAALKRELLDLWLGERNRFFKRVVESVEGRREAAPAPP